MTCSLPRKSVQTVPSRSGQNCTPVSAATMLEEDFVALPLEAVEPVLEIDEADVDSEATLELLEADD